MSTLSSANVTDVNLVLKERTHMRLCINMLILTHNLGNWLIVVKARRQMSTRHQGRIIHCAAVVPWEGAPVARGPRRSAAKFLPRCFEVWTFSVCLNVTTTKKGRQLFGGKKRTARFAYEKRAPALRWYGAPEWLSGPDSVRIQLTTVCSASIIVVEITSVRCLCSSGIFRRFSRYVHSAL